MLAFFSPVERARATEDGVEISVGGAESDEARAKLVVNSAGLHAPDLAARFWACQQEIPTGLLCQGNYFR